MTKPGSIVSASIDRLPYAMRKGLRQEHGPAAEAVLDVLVHHDTGAGVEITHDALATEAGISRSMTRRTLKSLCETGWIKRDIQIRGQRQIANCYQVVLGERGIQGAHSEQAPSVVTTKVDTDTEDQVLYVLEESSDIGKRGESDVSLVDQALEVTKVSEDEALDPPVAKQDHRGRLHELVGARCARRLNIVTKIPVIEELASAFQSHVETATGRTIRDQKRIEGFQTSARIMLADHRDAFDILDVIDFVFDQGLMANSYGEHKIKNLKQIRDDFDYFLAATNAGGFPDLDTPDDTTTVARGPCLRGRDPLHR